MTCNNNNNKDDDIINNEEYTDDLNDLIPEILPPTSDYVFYSIFGAEDCKYQLICFLNAILNGEPYIQDLEIVPTEYKKNISYGKTIRLDIMAYTDDGSLVNIEIQCRKHGDLVSRMLYYESIIIRDNCIKEGQSYGKIPSVISIWILKENITTRRNCKSVARWIYEANGSDPSEIMSYRQRRIIIELDKLKQTESNTISDECAVWLNFLLKPTELPEQYLNNKGVPEAMNKLKYVSHDMKARREWMLREMAEADYHNDITCSREEGVREGIIKGMLQKAKETAICLLGMKTLTLDQIAQASGLSVSDVIALRDERNT